MSGKFKLYSVEFGSFFCALALIAVLFSAGCAPVNASALTENTQTATTVPGKSFTIQYSVSNQDSINDMFRSSNGWTFLILDMVVQNKGYESVNTNPHFFQLSFNGIEYNSEVVLLNDYLKPGLLPDGESTSGKIAFHIPDNEINSPFKVIYESLMFIEQDINLITMEKE